MLNSHNALCDVALRIAWKILSNYNKSSDVHDWMFVHNFYGNNEEKKKKKETSMQVSVCVSLVSVLHLLLNSQTPVKQDAVHS